MKRKAVSLMSGGLDSVLATKLIMDQEIEVVTLHFTSPLTTPGRGRSDERRIQAVRSSAELGVEIIVKELGREYLDMVKSPRHGYGKNVNPCIDCKIFMLRESAHVMAEVGASFVVTGEVLGQRPMSQRREAMALIEKKSGLKGLIVRPLSAHRFDLTLPEQEGIIDRTKLLGITGRSRNPQYRLAERYDLTEFGCPAGGCLLTDPIFAGKLRDLFRFVPTCTMHDVALLKVGRHFRLTDGLKLIVGRDEGENGRLERMRQDEDILVSPNDFSGPSALLRGKSDRSSILIAANVIAHYSKESPDPVPVRIAGSDGIIETAFDRMAVNLNQFKILEPSPNPASDTAVSPKA
jgi:tRNA-uridine 2-sulfurtransferase